MQTINEILNFNFSPVLMKQAAVDAFVARTTRLLEIRIDKLKKLSQDIGESSFKFTCKNSIPQVFMKFKSDSFHLNPFDKKELRTITYSLSYSVPNISSIYSNPDELDLVFTILESHWLYLYLNGLIDCYLKNWESSHTVSMQKLGIFICKKLNSYKGGRTVLTSLKSNIKFFDYKKGNLDLGYTLASMNNPIKEATKKLALPDSWFSYSYFSKAILAYYEKRKKDISSFIEDLNEALKDHNNSITNKRIISKIIIQANSPNFDSLQDRVKNIAFKLIGDPANVSSWIPFEGATELEKNEIRKAREILDEWITKQFINVFFEKCINDPRRKNFWLKLSKHITAFKVHGPSNIKSQLKQDRRIAEFVNSRFHTTHDKKQISAFFMHVKDYKFIEFSDLGYAFYAYKQSNINSPSMNKTYDNVDSFRDGSLKMLVYRKGRYVQDPSDEGRLSHSDGDLTWEDILSFWMKEKVGIDVDV